MPKLLDGVAVDGASTEVFGVTAGEFALKVFGTLGGGTVEFRWRNKGETTFNSFNGADAQFTVAGLKNLKVMSTSEIEIDANLTGSSGASGVVAEIR